MLSLLLCLHGRSARSGFLRFASQSGFLVAQSQLLVNLAVSFRGTPKGLMPAPVTPWFTTNVALTGGLGPAPLQMPARLASARPLLRGEIALVHWCVHGRRAAGAADRVPHRAGRRFTFSPLRPREFLAAWTTVASACSSSTPASSPGGAGAQRPEAHRREAAGQGWVGAGAAGWGRVPSSQGTTRSLGHGHAAAAAAAPPTDSIPARSQPDVPAKPGPCATRATRNAGAS